MKAVRLLQIVIVLAAGAYLVLLHDMNEVNVVLPFLLSLPPAAVVVIALALGWLLGWLPPAVRGMRRGRELRQLRRRVAELEQDDYVQTADGLEPPVIPDRRPFETGETEIQEDYDGQENI
ncbi:MAG: lipopolysaccharide assembly protein LapA domain-containing protein [Trueperaceae bacterium]